PLRPLAGCSLRGCVVDLVPSISPPPGRPQALRRSAPKRESSGLFWGTRPNLSRTECCALAVGLSLVPGCGNDLVRLVHAQPLLRLAFESDDVPAAASDAADYRAVSAQRDL